MGPVSLDFLRPPTPFDATQSAYKDWLHLNFFDSGQGIAGLVNGSIHGSPTDPTSRVIGAALVHTPSGWAGNVAVRGIADAVIGLASVAVDEVAIGIRHADGLVEVSVQQPDSGLVLEGVATPASAPLRIEHRLPFGSGWISWSVVPSLLFSGTARVAERTLDLVEAPAYHDHNWGRWHWGDDVGWEWTVLPGGQDGPTLVFARTTDRTHSTYGEALLTLDYRDRRLFFTGESIDVEFEGWFAGRLRRVPGALAALHSDRVRPRLPERILLRARDGFDEVEVDFRTTGGAQLIAGDPVAPGYGFLHELMGSYALEGRVDGRSFSSKGTGVFEYVC